MWLFYYFIDRPSACKYTVLPCEHVDVQNDLMNELLKYLGFERQHQMKRWTDGSLCALLHVPFCFCFSSSSLCPPSFNAHTSSSLHSFTQEDHATDNTFKCRRIECYRAVFVLKQVIGRASRADDTEEKRGLFGFEVQTAVLPDVGLNCQNDAWTTCKGMLSEFLLKDCGAAEICPHMCVFWH